MQEKPTAIPVVAVALVDANGRALLQRRPLGKRHGGLWEFPGGKVEPEESRRAALAREIREELGIEIDPEHLIEAAEVDLRGTDPEGDPHVLFLYIATDWSGVPIPEEGAKIGWFTPEQARALEVPPLDRPLVDDLDRLISPLLRNSG